MAAQRERSAASPWCVNGTKPLLMFWVICPLVLAQQNHSSAVHLYRNPWPPLFLANNHERQLPRGVPKRIAMTQGNLQILKVRMYISSTSHSLTEGIPSSLCCRGWSPLHCLKVMTIFHAHKGKNNVCPENVSLLWKGCLCTLSYLCQDETKQRQIRPRSGRKLCIFSARLHSKWTTADLKMYTQSQHNGWWPC